MPRRWAARLAFGAVDWAARATGRRWPGDAAGLIAAATGGEGLSSSDDALVRAPLERLLHACAEEADLSAFGRISLHWDVLRLLRNLHRFAVEEGRDPAILRQPIRAPLIITGLPRSGTSFFHRLLVADPAARAPQCWQTIYPYPEPGARHDRRARRVDRQLRQFANFAPGLSSVHPIDSLAPQECTEITAHALQSLRFETMFDIPGYTAWLEGHGHAEAYRLHRRFLQHLQHQDAARGRWVLKCPDHVFALPALLAAYPDARVVFLHRDPLRVLPSVAQLTEVLRAPFARRLDRRRIGRKVTEDWVRGAALMVQEARRPRLQSGQVLHLRYRDVVGRPIDTVRRLYDHFGLELTDRARALMTRITARPRGGYGDNRYSFATHGIDPAELRQRFADYIQLFGVPSETASEDRSGRDSAAAAALHAGD